MSASANDRFETLLSIYLDGTLSPEQEREFATLLNNPECAQRLADALEHEQQLTAALGGPIPDAKMIDWVRQGIGSQGHAGGRTNAIMDCVREQDAVEERTARPAARRSPRRRSTSSWNMGAAAAALLLLAAGAAWWHFAPRGTSAVTVATIDSVADASARVTRASGRSEPAVTGLKLVVGDRIETAAAVGAAPTQPALRLTAWSAAQLDVGAGTHIDFAANTSNEKQLSIATGSIRIDSSALTRRGDRLVVRSPHGDVSPEGTRFFVTVRDTETAVRVEEGAVRVSNAHGSLRLAANEEGIARAQVAPARETLAVERVEPKGITLFTIDYSGLPAPVLSRGSGNLEWRIEPDPSEPSRQMLRLTFNHEPGKGWGGLQRKLGDVVWTQTPASIELEIRVLRHAPGAEFNVNVTDDDGDVLLVGYRKLDEIPQETWTKLSFPLKRSDQLQYRGGDGTFDPSTIKNLALGLARGNTEVLVREVRICAPAAVREATGNTF